MENGRSFFVSSSEGCAESGWTVYLDHSISDSPIASNYSYSNLSRRIKVEEEEEVDLSMVSDASSGPRINFPENEFRFPESGTEIGPSLPKNGRKIEERRRRRRDPTDNQTSSFLDDTATSDPNFNSVQFPFFLFYYYCLRICILLFLSFSFF